MAFGLPMQMRPATLCADKLANLIVGVAKNFALFIAMVIVCNGVHFLLKPYSQPRLSSDILVSFSISN